MFVDFGLPFKEPVLIFSVILLIILLTPIIFNKLKIPPIIGLIFAGALVGPNGFNLLERDASIILFGKVGLLYIMFLAGLEIDLNEFKKNKTKSIVFGLYTFMIPITLGTIIFYYVLKYNLDRAILIASMFASHTLVTYPIVSKFGITKNLAVNTTVGGTIITDTAALLVLAIIVAKVHGNITTSFWLQIGISLVLFVLIMFLIIPTVSRWFFKKTNDQIPQYLYVLTVVFFSSFLAILAGIEAIVGAFLAGLALNRLIPHTSPLMNRIEFVGNALFIPFFLLGVGMLIDYRIIQKGYETLIISLAMTSIAIIGKYFAAFLTQKTFKFTIDQRNLIFGLSNSQAAATLATVLIGYNIILGQTPDGEPIRLLNDNVLNGTIVMILITCTVSSFATQKAALKIAKNTANTISENDFGTQNTLIAVSENDKIDCLLQFAINTMDKKKQRELYALHVIESDKENSESLSTAKKLMENAMKTAAASDFSLIPIIRYDSSIISGIINTIKERNIKHFFFRLPEQKSSLGSNFMHFSSEILYKTDCSIYFFRIFHPLSTLKKILLLLPANAELEPNFFEWFDKIKNINQNIRIRFEIFASQETLNFLVQKKFITSNMELNKFEDFEDFLYLSKYINDETFLILFLSTKKNISYKPIMEKIPAYIEKYFTSLSFMLVMSSPVEAEMNEKPYINASLQENILQIKDTIENFFKKNKPH